MGDGVVALILLIAFIASAILFARRRSSQIDDIERGLPAELRGAEIAYAERTFRSHRHRLVARLDRAYRTSAGVQLVELKTRPRDAVYMSDVIELSMRAAEVGNRNVISDAGVGALAAQAALRSAALNVDINVPSLQDAAFAQACRDEIAALLASAVPLSEQAIALVKSKL